MQICICAFGISNRKQKGFPICTVKICKNGFRDLCLPYFENMVAIKNNKMHILLQ